MLVGLPFKVTKLPRAVPKGSQWKEEKLLNPNHYEGHVASSVIARGTLLLLSDLFVLCAFKVRCASKGQTLRCFFFFAEACQHGSPSNGAEKGGPLYVPYEWHAVRVPPGRRGLGGNYEGNKQTNICGEHGVSFPKQGGGPVHLQGGMIPGSSRGRLEENQ